jgi:hypothetical protein
MKKGYYIMTFVRNDADLFSLRRCIESIMHFDKQYHITVIDDNSPFTIEAFNIPRVNLIKNTYHPRSGEMFPYWYNTTFRVYDVFIMMHDSMVLKRTIPDLFWNKPCSMLWYFESARHMPHITANVRQICSSIANGNNLFNKYMHHMTQWVGCFGVSSMMQQSFLDGLFKKYDFEGLIKQVNNRPKREACERLMGVMISFELGKRVTMENCMNKCIFKHPEGFDWGNDKNALMPLGELLKKFEHYNSYLIKTWKGR